MQGINFPVVVHACRALSEKAEKDHLQAQNSTTNPPANH